MPGIGFNQPRHDLHQSGFARSISPHQRETIACLNDKAEIRKNGVTAKG
jgi:hypothetical protein